MAYPDGIVTRQVDFGSAFGIESGADIEMRVVLRANRALLWVPTGSPGIPVNVAVDASDTHMLPVTDQEGWGDGQGGIIVPDEDTHTHTYIASVQYWADNRELSHTSIGPFVLPTGDLSPVDIDNLLPLSSETGATVFIPDSWSVQVEAAQQAALDAVEAMTSTEGLVATATQKAADAAGSAATAEASEEAAAQSATDANVATLAALAAQAASEAAQADALVQAGIATARAGEAAQSATDADADRVAAAASAAAAAAAVSAALVGTGSPEGVQVASPGKRYIDTAKTLGARVWYKDTGTGNTGWKVAEGNTGARNILTTIQAQTPTFAVGYGSAQIQRINDMVFLDLALFSAPAGTLWTPPAGFRKGAGQFKTISIVTVNGILAPTSQIQYQIGDIVIIGAAVVSKIMAGTLAWTTTDAWPTSLPGTAL